MEKVAKKTKQKRSKSLHPSTIFHFTNNEEAFYSILTERRFKPFLARERITGIGSRRQFAVPMVSFCDIRLSQIDDHTFKYGEFGFGLTKTWAVKKKLHPVLYMEQGGGLFSNYNKRVRIIKNELLPLWNKRKKLNPTESKLFNALKDEYSDLYNLLRYMKNYKGKLVRPGEKDADNYIFADEKEWRYVPEPFVGDMWPSLNLERVISYEDKKKFSEGFFDFSINFTLDDIKYILVPDDSYMLKVINCLSNSESFDNEFISKILTMDKVVNDF